MPAAGTAAAAAGAGPAATIGIFFISGLLLQRGESLAALRSTVAVAYGLVTVLLITPLLALAIVRLPLQPPEVALGLAIFCCMPTTLSANVMLTTASGGNTAVALLLTIASNTLAVRARAGVDACLRRCLGVTAAQLGAERMCRPCLHGCTAASARHATLSLLVSCMLRPAGVPLLMPLLLPACRCSPFQSCCPWCWAAQLA